MNKKTEKPAKKEDLIKVDQYGNNPSILQITKGNHFYLLNRNKYDINKIMMMVDYHKLSILGEKFRSCKEGVSKVEFVKSMYEELKNPKFELNEIADLVYGIYKYFCEIDYNGDNNMEWEEFTQFIIDKVEGEYGNTEKEEDIKDKMASQKEMVKYKRYEVSENIKDYNIHKSDVFCTAYMGKINKLLVNEYNTHFIKIYNPLNGKIENSIDIHQINDEVEKIKIDELLRDDKSAQKMMGEVNKNKLQKNKSTSLKKILGQNYLRKKLQEKKNFGRNYSIIYFTTYGTIIAVALSNKQIQFFSVANNIEGELIYTLNCKSLQKRIWYLEQHKSWYSSGDKETDEDYFFLNELDIDFQNKSGYWIGISRDLPYRKRFSRICQHKGEIYDAIETKRPCLILTACLDGYIRLIDVNDAEFLKTWKYHNLGVKHLDYNPNLESNGYIISTGFEYYINIFCTDLSLDEAYKGKLEGHFVPVINCRFICGSPICVSVDEEGNVRIWEIQLRTCLQSIPITKKNFIVNGILVMERINKFIVYGNNILFYDAKYKDKKEIKKEIREDNYPIKVCFNKYYQEFYVTTLKDVRIFNKHGYLEKTFRKCIENENFEPGTKIRDFIFEDHHRKFYLGFSNGAIMQYNSGNGSLIKQINQYEVEKEGVLYYKFYHSKDVSSLYFFYQKRDKDKEKDNYLLISTSFDSTIQVYNECDLLKTSKLRTIKGGHTLGEKKCEILCMDFSNHLCQLATGSSDGLIVVWDFVLTKIKDVLYLNPKFFGIKLDVLCVKFLNKHPLLFSSYSEGICILWAIDPFRLEGHNKMILKFHNFYQTNFKLDLCDVLCCHFIENTIKNVEEKFLNRIYFVDEQECIEERNKIRKDAVPGEELPLIKKDELENESIIDESIDPNNYNNLYIDDDNIINNNNDSSNNRGNNCNRPSQYLVICDRKGFIKVLNLRGIFIKYKEYLKNINPVIGNNCNLLKKEDTNVENILVHLINTSTAIQKKIYNQLFHNLYAMHIINKEWRGHYDSITDCCFIEDPISTVTVSQDQYLRVWNEKFELIAEINVIPTETSNKYFKKDLVPWGFKINEKKIMEKEINEVVTIFEEVGVPKIIKGSSNEAKFSYLRNPIEDKKTEIKQTVNNEDNFRAKKIKEERKKKKNEIRKDDKDFNSSYEVIFLKNLSNKIENLLQNKPMNQGMGEISSNLISTMINERKKSASNRVKSRHDRKNKSILKERGGKKGNKGATSTNLIRIMSCGGENEKEGKEEIKEKKDISDTNLVNISRDIIEEEKIIEKPPLLEKFFSHELYKNNFLNKDKETKDLLNLSNNNNNNNFGQTQKLPSSIKKFQRINTGYTPHNRQIFSSYHHKEQSQQPFSGNFSQNMNYSSGINTNKNNNFTNNAFYQRPFSHMRSKDYSYELSKKAISSRRIRSTFSVGTAYSVHHAPPHIFNRDNLYSEKLLSKLSAENCKIRPKLFPKIKSRDNENEREREKEREECIKNYKGINYEVKEKTEKLVKKQFYLNSYKNCCQIIPNSSLQTNLSIIHNYRNMWNNVQLYTKEIVNGLGEGKNKNRKRKQTGKLKSGFVRSQSVGTLFRK